MAGPLPCDNHQDRIATVLSTRLDGSASLTLCDECYIQHCLAIVTMLSGAPEITQEELEAEEEAADLEGEAPLPDASPKSEPETEATPEPVPAEGAATAQETEAAGN